MGPAPSFIFPVFGAFPLDPHAPRPPRPPHPFGPLRARPLPGLPRGRDLPPPAPPGPPPGRVLALPSVWGRGRGGASPRMGTERTFPAPRPLPPSGCRLPAAWLPSALPSPGPAPARGRPLPPTRTPRLAAGAPGLGPRRREGFAGRAGGKQRGRAEGGRLPPAPLLLPSSAARRALLPPPPSALLPPSARHPGPARPPRPPSPPELQMWRSGRVPGGRARGARAG